MNLNPTAKTILCYGDSNTWGANPNSGLRYPADIRWVGIAQKKLGDNYYLIEEGLNGRTTMYTDPQYPRKNGLEYLEISLHTHKPLDLVIFMLGTNDVKIRYGVKEETIGKGIEELIKASQNYLDSDDEQRITKILVISPPLIKDVAAQNDERMVNAPKLSKLFASEYKAVADKYNCFFLDASSVIESSNIDGYHLDEVSHEQLGIAVAEKIKSILNE